MFKSILASLFLAFSLVSTTLLPAFAGDNEELEHAHAQVKKGNLTEAFKTVEPLAQKGHPAAQCLLGMMYQKGAGCHRDCSKAAEWYKKSASHGFADAQSRLGHMYLNGNEIHKDTVQAEHWLGKAAHQGVPEAQLHLGQMYLKAVNNKKLLEGRRLVRLAADQGLEDAKKTLDEIPGYDKMRDAVASRGQRAGSNFSQGLGNIETSWEGYADMVQSMNAAVKEASQ